jgi:hypothetical protein
MVNIPPILSSRVLIAFGVMTPAILMMASFCAASILYAAFFVLLDILPLLVETVAGQFLLLFLLCPRWRALDIIYYLLNLWLMLKLIIRILTNYETVYLSVGLCLESFSWSCHHFGMAANSRPFLLLVFC